MLKARTYARIDPARSSWQLERPPGAPRSGRLARSRSFQQRPQRPASSSGSNSHESGERGSRHGDTTATAVTGGWSQQQQRHIAQANQRTRASNATSSSRYYRRNNSNAATDSVSARHPSTNSHSSSSDRGSSPPRARRSRESSSLVLLDSRPASPALSSSTGSYDVLRSSLDSLQQREATPQSHDGFVLAEASESLSRSATPRSPSSPRSPRSPASRTSLPSAESEGESVSAASGAVSSYAGVSSMQSSMHLSSNDGSGSHSSSQPSSRDQEREHEVAARLVTIHLTKIDAGMWPILISGPAPVGDDFDGMQSTDSRRSFQSDDDSGTILASSSSSAISATTAGRRRHRRPSLSSILYDSDSGEQEGDTRTEDAAKFNMDPVSLVLMGFQIRSTSPLRFRPGIDEAFEYFVKSWRKTDLPVATRVLVREYFPINVVSTATAAAAATTVENEIHMTTLSSSPGRPRMIAALGGRTALARLYCSYARLSLSNTYSQNAQHHRSYLFPSGPGHSRDPYSGILLSGGVVDYTYARSQSSPARSPSSPPPPSSPPRQSEAEYMMKFGPLTFLEEARRLDPNIPIDHMEWAEARSIYESAALEFDAEAAADEMSAGSGYFDSGANGGDDDAGAEDEVQRRRRQSRSKHERKRRKAGSGSGSKHKVTGDTGLVAVLSGAALVSFAVAGGVAALGWWKRAGGGAAATASAGAG